MSKPQPAKRHAPAALRNRDPIASVLRDILPARGLVLEIASGSGEHAVHFAGVFPDLDWQPSDPDEGSRASILAWSQESGLGNLRPPLDIDASAADWPIGTADAIICVNMLHISPWNATLGLLAGARRITETGAPLYLYGPFRRPGHALEPSNAEFDRSLRARNPDWGLRDLGELVEAAKCEGFRLESTLEMPANNLSVILRKV